MPYNKNARIEKHAINRLRRDMGIRGENPLMINGIHFHDLGGRKIGNVFFFPRNGLPQKCFPPERPLRYAAFCILGRIQLSFDRHCVGP